MDKTLRRILSLWTAALLLMVAGTILVGGVTRLTNSGLSITEWKPIMGTIPPLSDADWQEAFDKYKQIPEYAVEHSDMELSGFKFIFFWEWFHRNLGRMVGFVALVPLILLSRSLPAPYFRRFGIGFVLILLQGVMGWVMVRSGLSERVDVSHYRLAIHLVLAFFIFSHYQRLLIDLCSFSYQGEQNTAPSGARRAILVLHSFLGLQIVYGALVAGLRAGYMYNTFPKMSGEWIPIDSMVYHPTWLAAFESPVAVQFIHRWLAVLVLLLATLLPWYLRREGANFLAPAARVFLCSVVCQAALGIATLVLKMPIMIASLHQLGGLITFASMTVLMHSSRPAPQKSKERQGPKDLNSKFESISSVNQRKENSMKWKVAGSGVCAALALGLGSFSQAQNASNGEKVFKQACASCHSASEKKESYHTGPALYGVTKRPGRTDQWLLDWISDPSGMLKKDALAKQLLKESNNVPMPNMLATLNGNDPAKVKAAAQDILAYLKQNDAGSGGTGDPGKKKKN